HTITASTTASPCRRTRVTHPVNVAPTSAPAPGAPTRSPSTPAPPWNRSMAIAGNKARGIPKIMASRSMRNVLCNTLSPRRNDMPSRIDRKPSRVPSDDGGSGCIIETQTNIAEKVDTSTQYAVASPTRSMKKPATPAPTELASWYMIWLSAADDASWSRRTSVAKTAEAVGPSIPEMPPDTAIRRYSGQTAGLPRPALIAKPADVAAIATWVTSRSRRRSTASTIGPRRSDVTSSGPNAVRLTSPTCSDEWVISNTWNGTPTIVNCRPTYEIVWPV